MYLERRKRRSRAKGVAETYIHIKDIPESLTKEEVFTYLQKNAHLWAEKHFKQSVYVEIIVEDGSLKARVRIGAKTLMSLLIVYGGMRAGIDYLVDDSWSFSDTVIEHFNSDEHIADESIIRAERRLGVPGKIQRFYRTLDRLNSNEYGHNQRQEMVDDLKEELISIIELLESNEDRNAFMSELPDFIAPNPNEPLPEPIRGSITLGINRNEDDD